MYAYSSPHQGFQQPYQPMKLLSFHKPHNKRISDNIMNNYRDVYHRQLTICGVVLYLTQFSPLITRSPSRSFASYRWSGSYCSGPMPELACRICPEFSRVVMVGLRWEENSWTVQLAEMAECNYSIHVDIDLFKAVWMENINVSTDRKVHQNKLWDILNNQSSTLSSISKLQSGTVCMQKYDCTVVLFIKHSAHTTIGNY